MSDIRQTVGDLDTLLTSAFDGTEFVEVFPTSGGVSKKTAAGTAVSANVQTSITDTTANRVMLNKAYGLGGSILSSEVNANSYLQPGFYLTPLSGHTDFPSGNNSRAILSVIGDTGYITQILSRRTDNTTWVRTADPGSLASTAWVELYDSGNYPSDTAWTTPPSLSNGWTGTLRYIKRAGWVAGTGNVNGTAKSTDVVFTLGADYQPDVEYYDTANDSGTIRNVTITTGGAITIPGTSASVFFSFAYPVIT